MCRSCEWTSNGYRAPRRDESSVPEPVQLAGPLMVRTTLAVAFAGCGAVCLPAKFEDAQRPSPRKLLGPVDAVATPIPEEPNANLALSHAS